MKHNAIFITPKNIFFSTHDIRKNVYLKNSDITESSRQRINRLIRDNKIYTVLCSFNTVCFTRT